MSSRDLTETPDELELTIQRLRAKRERAVDVALVGPDYADERDSEPSYRMALSEPGQRLSVEGEDPAALAELVERVRHKPTLIERGAESIAPITRRMDSRGGRLTAIITGGMLVLGAALKAITWLQENGFLD